MSVYCFYTENTCNTLLTNCNDQTSNTFLVYELYTAAIICIPILLDVVMKSQFDEFSTAVTMTSQCVVIQVLMGHIEKSTGH